MRVVIDEFNSNVSSYYFNKQYLKKYRYLNVFLFLFMYITLLIWILMLQYRIIGLDYRPAEFIFLTCFVFGLAVFVIVILRRVLTSICKNIAIDFNLELDNECKNLKVIKKAIQVKWVNKYLTKYELRDRSLLLGITNSLHHHEFTISNKLSKRFGVFTIVGVATITYWANEFLSLIIKIVKNSGTGLASAILVLVAIVLCLFLVGFMQFMINAFNETIKDIFASEETKSTNELIEILEEILIGLGDD